MSNLFDIKMVFTQIPDLLTYLPVTLELAVVSMIVSLILGLILALIKMKKIPVLKQLANLYISVIRGTPVLVQLYVTYFGIPMILKAINLKYGTNYNANGVAPIIYAFIALAVNESAYNAEVIRASLESVPKGQIEAANALGMTYFQALRRVILLVSHEMNFVKNVATRVIFLENGKIIEDGPPKEVFNHPKSDRVREFFAKINRMVEPEYSI